MVSFLPSFLNPSPSLLFLSALYTEYVVAVVCRLSSSQFLAQKPESLHIFLGKINARVYAGVHFTQHFKVDKIITN